VTQLTGLGIDLPICGEETKLLDFSTIYGLPCLRALNLNIRLQWRILPAASLCGLNIPQAWTSAVGLELVRAA